MQSENSKQKRPVRSYQFEKETIDNINVSRSHLIGTIYQSEIGTLRLALKKLRAEADTGSIKLI